MREAVVQIYATRTRAVKYAQSFDRARKFNRLPLLTVRERQDGLWEVVNPDADAPMYPPRTPVTDA